MTLAVRSLASGSNGNSVLVRAAGGAVLVDAGLPLPRLEAVLQQAGQNPHTVQAICITHEHTDHSCGAAAFASRYVVPLVCNDATYAALGAPDLPWRELPTGETIHLDELDITSFALPHDAVAPVGYRLAHAGGTVAIATDFGHWTDEIVAALAGGDLLLLEANHQRERLANCGYPGHLQRRVRGKLGHLANDQTAALLVALSRRDPRPRTVWLAHLSARSNTPLLALAEVSAALAAARISTIQLAVAPRGKPSSWWTFALPLHQQSFWDAKLVL